MRAPPLSIAYHEQCIVYSIHCILYCVSVYYTLYSASVQICIVARLLPLPPSLLMI